MKFSLFALGAKSQMAGVAGVLSAVLAAPSAAGDPGLSAGERQLPAAERQLQQSAGWHGRAVREPHAHAVAPAAREAPPRGWSAGAVSRGSGYWHAGGSERVREVQRGLNRLGYEPGRVDGLFGPRTEGAVQQFQRKHGLKVDGVVGPQTRRHLRYRSAQGKRRSSAGQRRSSAGQRRSSAGLAPRTNPVEQAESGTREAPSVPPALLGRRVEPPRAPDAPATRRGRDADESLSRDRERPLRRVHAESRGPATAIRER